jgi:hypothetical protein
MLQKAAVTTSDQMSLVRELLSVSDMVKFAKYVPAAGLHEKYHADAVRFVTETKVADLPAEGEKEKGGRDA